jgi:Cu-Zn family superoxide dismutase
MKLVSALMLGTVILSGCAGMSKSAPAPIAVATLNPTQGNAAKGTVSFVQQGEEVMIDARFDGLPPGMHGFHVHEKGDCSAPDAMSAGGHFNPGSTPHGDPAHADHHAGDFGNLNADASGNATLKLTVPAKQLTLAKDASNSVVGRALVVHADQDDLKTQPTGNSGKRVACGVVSLQ